MEFLINRDGKLCQRCGTTDDLTLDHVDNDRENHAVTNIQILCRPCNTTKNNRLRAGGNQRISVGPGDLNINKKPLEMVALINATPETQLRYLYWPAYKKWIIEKISERGSITPDEAKHAGAMAVDCSASTAYNYFKQLTSFEGSLRIIVAETGVKVAVLREGRE